MTTFSPSRICWPFSSVSQRRRAAEVREGREHPQRLLDRARDQRRVVEQELALVGVLHQRPHRRCSRSPSCCRCRPPPAGRSPSRSRAPRASAPSISAWTSTLVRSSVGFSRRSAIICRQRSKISGMSLSTTLSTPSGLRSGSPAPSVEFIRSRPDRVVLRRDAHEAADHARDDGLGDVVDEVAGLPALEPVEHARRRSRGSRPRGRRSASA